MTRSIFRHVRWHLGRDRSTATPDAPRHVVTCTTCGAESAPTDTVQEAQNWPFEHIGTRPRHTGYEVRVSMWWRMTPVDGSTTPVRPAQIHNKRP